MSHCSNDMVYGTFVADDSERVAMELTEVAPLNFIMIMLNGTRDNLTGEFAPGIPCSGSADSNIFNYDHVTCTITFSFPGQPIWVKPACPDSCTSNPCRNDGTCIVDGANFNCTCLLGFNGTTCEQDSCTSSPCENGGTCSADGENFNCTCLPGFNGTICQNDIDECSSVHLCENNGACIDEINGYSCNCSHEYTGQYCEQKLCFVQKSTACLMAPLLEVWNLTNNTLFNSGNDDDVNHTLSTLKTFDKTAIEILCKQAQCDENALSNLIEDLNILHNQTEELVHNITKAKSNLRLAIECRYNNASETTVVFEHYEAVSKRRVLLTNAMTDLIIKRNVVTTERLRCQSRSWLRRLLEHAWRK